jgi:zinc protease
MMNERLRELGRAADPPYQSAFASSGELGRTKSAYTLFARVSNGGVERGLATLLTEARRVEKYGFAETELERAKIAFRRSLDRAYEERDKQESARYASQYVNRFLDDEPAPGIAYVRDLFNELIPGITLAEINARADQWISDNNRVILVSGPEKKEAAIPQEARLLEVFKETDQVALTPWVDKFRNEPLVSQVPSPGRIVEGTRIDEIGVTRWKLSNGPVVLLKPTDFKNDELVMRGWSPGGVSLASDDMHLSATRAAEIVAQMGIGKFDRTELDKALTGKVVAVNPVISELSEAVRGTASTHDVETLFQLLYLRFTGVRRDPKAFDSFRSTLRGQLENQAASPPYELSKKINEVLTQDHPRRRFLTHERVSEIDLDKAITFYNQRFGDASDFIFTFVGNMDLAAMRPLVEKWIGGLPASGRVETWRDVGVEEPSGVQKVRVEKGLEPQSTVRIVFHGDAPWSIANAHRIASLAEVLRIRLREELREDRGGVYGVGVSGGISRYPDEEYTFTISFTADPTRVDELVAATFEQIAKLKADGAAEDYINRVREMQRRGRELELKQNGFWVAQLEYLASNKLDLREVLRHDGRIAGVTTEAMREAAKTYLDESRYVIGVLAPEVK